MNRTLSSILTQENLDVLEKLFEQYKKNPTSVDPQTRQFFQELETESDSHADNGREFYIPKLTKKERETVGSDLEVKILLLIQAYRRQGHYSAITDPLHLTRPARYHLSLEDHGMSEADLNREVQTFIGNKPFHGTVAQVVERMERTYCSSVGAEFFYIRNEERRGWLVERMESQDFNWPLSHEVKKQIFEKLFSAEYFEKFLAANYPGKKRFSLEGGESLIPSLASAIDMAGTYGIKQMVIGMAHRGRLNVLHNILNKEPALIFAEFNEAVSENTVDGDVKYHLGYSNDTVTMSGSSVHLSLGFNPSHLEVINPVVMGSVRARQTRAKDVDRSKYMPILIHGDAAFSGQGINYECLNMSNLEGYYVGGTFHIISNNQIGFTTDPTDSRSTRYCTDLVKMLQVPIFHVNGDDPEACYRAVQLCMEWKERYRTDVFLDLICYRRWGHNETDEPTFTQPIHYRKIKEQPTTVQIYEKRLLAEGMPAADLEAIKDRVKKRLEEALKKVKSEEVRIQVQTLKGDWAGFQKEDPTSEPVTSVDREKLEFIARQITTFPSSFQLHPKIKRLMETRREMIFSPEGKMDWGMGESLAYGSLLMDGTRIRLSGQDVKRGTFSHRHAALIDVEDGNEYIPLKHLKEGQGDFEIINSLLSEVAVLGFEFGYSLADPRTLVIWEAQFGDFANGAQVIIDQFISSCETKWSRMSGLVMLLPHGYEGQGPEHSSARLERFLQLCSHNNIQVCNCSTPAQYFHLIRRQMGRNYRKPLIVMSPKSLLRHPLAMSEVKELVEGAFAEAIGETSPDIHPENVERLILCSGKVYYDLYEAREKAGITSVAIARIEQLYPYPVSEVADIIEKYSRASEVCWVQEEPRNQGAWIYMEHYLSSQIGEHQELRYIGRRSSASPATGYHRVHEREQKEIVELSLKPGHKLAVSGSMN